MQPKNGTHFVLSTGRDLYANEKSIGINPDMDLFEGYDGMIEPTDWTPDEKRELADYMIALWQQFKDSING